MTITVTDLFCGAGGSSSGLERIEGVQVRMAANHWTLAIETHNHNLPHADHDCADISQVDPRRYPATNILWASPECTNHSQARGKRKDNAQPDLFGEVLPDAAAERSRATMMDVPRFLEAMILRGRPYDGFIVENVVEVRDWMYYETWLQMLKVAGYCVHLVYMNSMFASAGGVQPAPQSRDRWYAVGHRTAIRCPDLRKWTRPEALCDRCGQVVIPLQAWKNANSPHGKYNSQYVWRCPNAACQGNRVYPPVLPAAAVIDWSMPGQRIGDRERPLADKTMARIEAGLAKYARPVMVPAGGTWNDSATPLDEPMRTRTSRETDGIACPPFLALLRSDRNRTIGIGDPMATVVADGSNHALVQPQPILVPLEGFEGKQARPASEPLRTQTARHQDALIVPPLVIPMRNNNTAKPAAAEPLDTIAANGNHHGLVIPPGGMIMRNNNSAGQMCTGLDEPLRTLTSAGHQSLITWEALLVEYHGRGGARPVTEPMGALTTVDRYGLLSGGAATSLDVLDCLFRMLEPGEIKLGMAFAPEYVLLGNRRERVKQAGNAVTPPAATVLGAALVEAITGETPVIR